MFFFADPSSVRKNTIHKKNQYIILTCLKLQTQYFKIQTFFFFFFLRSVFTLVPKVAASEMLRGHYMFGVLKVNYNSSCKIIFYSRFLNQGSSDDWFSID